MKKPLLLPYPILYSSSFVADDPKNAESLLAIWKAYDAADFSSVRNLFADTVEVHLASGLTMRTSRDSTLAAVAAYRNSMKSAVSSISAIMAVKSTDKDQHWALIWGMEKDMHKNGKAGDEVRPRQRVGTEGGGGVGTGFISRALRRDCRGPC